MITCCGQKRDSKFCAECGKSLTGIRGELLKYCSQQLNAQNVLEVKRERNYRNRGEKYEPSEHRMKMINKWKRWVEWLSEEPKA